jgi:phosphoribosylanthranilate isomerase
MTAALAQPRPLVKVCGLTRPRDVALAAELGAWALGFVFAPSPRQVGVEVVRELGERAREMAPTGSSHRRCPLVVGVFGDCSPQVIADIANAAGLDAVQLHGSRPDAAAVRRALGDREPRVLVIRAVPVAAVTASVASVREAVAVAWEGADLLLFDTQTGSRWGGTGTTFPWQIAREAVGASRYLVAGGIGPHNVGEALEASGAWGVDVSSGVEVSPGVKDERRLRALFAAVEGVSAGEWVPRAEEMASTGRENQERREGTTI